MHTMDTEEALLTLLGAVLAGRAGGTKALDYCQHLTTVGDAVRDACSLDVQAKIIPVIERFRTDANAEVEKLVRRAMGFNDLPGANRSAPAPR